MNLLIAWLCVSVFCVFCAIAFWFYAILVYCAVLGIIDIIEKIRGKRYE